MCACQLVRFAHQPGFTFKREGMHARTYIIRGPIPTRIVREWFDDDIWEPQQR